MQLRKILLQVLVADTPHTINRALALHVLLNVVFKIRISVVLLYIAHDKTPKCPDSKSERKRVGEK